MCTDRPAVCLAVEKRPKGHVLVEGETAVDKVKRDADLLAAEEDEEEDDAEIGATLVDNKGLGLHTKAYWYRHSLLSMAR